MSANDSASPAPTHPLAYVVLELQIPFSPRMTAHDTLSDLMSRLGHLPVLREETRQTMTPSDGGFEVRQAPGWRLMDRDSTRSLILTQTSLTYEVTRYGGFESFSAEVNTWLAAIEAVCAPVGYDRLGLRYVNEVRPLDSISTFGDWSHVMAPDYVGALMSAQSSVQHACLNRGGDGHDGSVPHEPRDASGLASDAVAFGPEQEPLDARDDFASCYLQMAETKLFFHLPDNAGMTLRLANGEGSGIIGNAPLKRYQLPEPGPFFVVDFDGFWPADGRAIRAFNKDDIVEQMGRVHAPVKSSFKWATTQNYREGAGVVAQ